MQQLGIFCGSSMGKVAIYREKTAELGRIIARQNLVLIYGGANIGLMRVLADSVIGHGGRVIGVMPRFLLDKEILHKGIHEIHIVESMHERKAKIACMADAFVALPGGFGTLDEMAEIFSWNQLEVFSKPIALFNIDNYFEHLIRYLDHCVEERFLRVEHRMNILVHSDAASLIMQLSTFKPIPVHSKWVDELKLM